MAQKYDGAVRLDTSIDEEGLSKAIKRLEDSVQKFAKTTTGDFEKIDKSVEQTSQSAKKLEGSFKIDDADIKKAIAGHENLNAKIEVEERQLANLRREYERVSSRQGENSQASLRLQKQILNTESSVRKMIASSDKMAESIRAMEEQTEAGAEGIKKLGDESEKAADNMEIDASGVSSAFDTISDVFSSVGSDISNVAAGIGQSLQGAPVAGAAAIVGALGKITQAAVTSANDIEKSAARMRISMGLTVGEATEATYRAREIYSEGYAKSEKDVLETLTAVMQITRLQGEEAENATKKLIAMGLDGAEAAMTMRTMMRQFGITSDEALDIIQAGIQKGLNGSGEWLGVLNEYSPAFQRLGYSAGDFLNTMVAGFDAGGYSIDKTADAIKEFYNKAARGDTAFAEALKGLRFDSDQTIKRLTGGGDAAKQTFEKVAKRLSDIQDKSKQAQMASALFGSRWEDVGTEVTLAISKAKKELIDFTDAAQKAVDIAGGTGQSGWDGFFRSWWTAIQKALGMYGNHAYATGTASATRGMALVGERGPELVEFKGGERIYNATQTLAARAMAGSVPSAYTNLQNIYVTIDAKNVREFSDVVRIAQNARQSRRMGYVKG